MKAKDFSSDTFAKYARRKSLRVGCNQPKVPTTRIRVTKLTLTQPPSSMSKKTMGKLWCWHVGAQNNGDEGYKEASSE
jgi:hypothetical protein